uniref:Putative secreted protein n=1 Tax=Anopheles marajoara TaxID=58244 RepID=A0A2M4CBL0_9DIPT
MFPQLVSASRCPAVVVVVVVDVDVARCKCLHFVARCGFVYQRLLSYRLNDLHLAPTHTHTHIPRMGSGLLRKTSRECCTA